MMSQMWEKEVEDAEKMLAYDRRSTTVIFLRAPTSLDSSVPMLYCPYGE